MKEILGIEQSRSGANDAVQGRSGGTADGKGAANPNSSNPPASADKPSVVAKQASAKFNDISISHFTHNTLTFTFTDSFIVFTKI